MLLPKKPGDIIKPLIMRDINLISCAIWISIDNCVSLGGDVETGTDDAVGWKAIISEPVCRELGCTLIKVPHHGSPIAFYSAAWEKISSNSKPIAIITPYINLSDPFLGKKNSTKF